jgi:hypothetical protein
MSIAFTKVNDFVEDLGNGVHDMDNDQLVIVLSNTAPSGESSDPTADGNGVLANVTQINHANLSSRNLTTTSWSLSSGTAKLIIQDLTLTASGVVPEFRYIYLYNDDATSDNLIGVYDLGVAKNMGDGDTFICNFDDSAGVLTIT